MRYIVIFLIFFVSNCYQFKENPTDIFTLEGLLFARLISNTFPVYISGTITGLESDTLVLDWNGSSKYFAGPISHFSFISEKDRNFSITIQSQPEFFNCSLKNGNGNTGRFGYNKVEINCIAIE